DLDQTGWVFRGLRAHHPLATSLERCCDRESIPREQRGRVERELIREFRRSYHHYALHLPEPDAHAEWLSVMQHHGAPTRLLDFSYSIFVAAFFAVEGASIQDDCAVWAMNANWLHAVSADRFLAEGKNPADVEKIINPYRSSAEEGMVERLFLTDE